MPTSAPGRPDTPVGRCDARQGCRTHRAAARCVRYAVGVPPDPLRALWALHFDGVPECEASAPGRVNLIGEHTDYTEGFVLPAAISLRTHALLRRTAGPVRLVSAQAGEGKPFEVGSRQQAEGWARYAAACARALEDKVGEKPPAVEGVVQSELPVSSGLGSSAALELCLLAGWSLLGGYDLSALDLARIGWEAETRYVGVSCGMMDQLAAALGRRGHAVFLDTRSLEATFCPIPNDLTIAVLDTRKRRALGASAYNQRVAECRRALEAIRRLFPQVAALRDATEETLSSAAEAGLDDVACRRARHVIRENERTLAFRDALAANERAALGALCRASHESLRDDYDVSCPELDAMARAAWNAPGCVSARLTGAGFGGCCVALVNAAQYQEFERSVRSSYDMHGFPAAAYYRTEADDGARAAY